MASAADLNKQYIEVSKKVRTCAFRFYDMCEVRAKQFRTLADNYENHTNQNEARQKILTSADKYINCLRNNRGELSQNLLAQIKNFKTQLYSSPKPVWMLEDAGHQLATNIYKHQITQ